MRVGAASIWLVTALGVLHPHYREIGAAYLAKLGLPDQLMWACCAGELVLGLVVLWRPAARLVVLVQIVLVAGFTLILASLDPRLLVHPFGILTKNIPFVALVAAHRLAATEGWTRRAGWTLRAGMTAIWLTEGIFPKILFQQPFELEVVSRSGLAPIDPAVFLVIMGALQAASGVVLLVASGRLLGFLIACQIAALVAMPLVVSAPDPLLWVHPFGPMTKNLPILAGHLVLLRLAAREPA